MCLTLTSCNGQYFSHLRHTVLWCPCHSHTAIHSILVFPSWTAFQCKLCTLPFAISQSVSLGFISFLLEWALDWAPRATSFALAMTRMSSRFPASILCKMKEGPEGARGRTCTQNPRGLPRSCPYLPESKFWITLCVTNIFWHNHPILYTDKYIPLCLY